jgi:murein L,D-transpeptidase YcbB/YkuD
MMRPRNVLFSNVGLLAVTGIVAYLGFNKLRSLYAAGTINPASRENVIYQATGEIGTKVVDWFPWLKSDAEKAVDAMLKAPLPSAAPVTTLSRVLRYGSAGSDVKTLQGLLGLASRDGVFGDQVLAAVKDFQRRAGLVVDGVVGPATWSALQSGRAVVTQAGVLISGSDRTLIR